MIVTVEAKQILRARLRDLDQSGEVSIGFLIQREARSIDDDFHTFSPRRPQPEMHSPAGGLGSDREPPLDHSRHSFTLPSCQLVQNESQSAMAPAFYVKCQTSSVECLMYLSNDQLTN
jgi:hypothetical protein